MTKKQFAAAAEIVKFMQGTRAEKMMVARSMVELFRRFNGRFDDDRFYRACGLEGL